MSKTDPVQQEEKLQKRFKNESGDLLVREIRRDKTEGEDIVELVYLYDDNKSGCVICFWELRSVDGRLFPELHEVHDRLTTSSLDVEALFEAIEFGRELANLINRL